MTENEATPLNLSAHVESDGLALDITLHHVSGATANVHLPFNDEVDRVLEAFMEGLPDNFTNALETAMRQVNAEAQSLTSNLREGEK